jgi:hypothetical protein
MFGLDRLKYRSEVNVQVHAILKLMPALTQLLETFPTLKSTINELRKQKMPPAEAACSLCVLVIKRAVAEIPDQAPRLLTLEQLGRALRKGGSKFRIIEQIENLSDARPVAAPAIRRIKARHHRADRGPKNAGARDMDG